MARIGLILIAVFTTLVACSDENNQREEDAQSIADYIEAKGLDAESTASGLHYVIEEPGGNERPTLNNTISIVYRGTFLDGREFDSSNGQPVTFPLRNLIPGWQEGIPLFGRGGKGILIVPSHLGYGPAGRGSVPPNSVLVFDIELVDFD